MSNKSNQIVRASWIAIWGNGSLALLKISIGLYAGSLAVLGDGLDTASDIVTSIITLFTANIVSKPPNKKFAYGYRRADSVAAKALSFVIFFAGIQLTISTISRLFYSEERSIPSNLAIYVTILSIFGKLLLAVYLLKKSKKLNSSVLRANGKNMQSDIFISVAVLSGLFFTHFLNLPILDIITAFAISIWIMRTAYLIFKESNIELMDGITDPSVYEEIFNAVGIVEGAYNPHRTRVRKLGDLYNVSIDVEVAGDITVTRAHEIARKVEKTIRNNLHNVYDVFVHIEPLGNTEKNEKFGLSINDINNY